MAPPCGVKEYYVLRLVLPDLKGRMAVAAGAQDFTPRCHPDAAAIPKRDAGQSPATTQSAQSTRSSWRDNIAFKAMGWGLKESCDRLQLLAGDRLDIAYSLGMNDHPEFGGFELTLPAVRRAR